jgi:glutathione S-transferase
MNEKTSESNEMHYELIFGNKAYSSWSLRGYLLFQPFGIAYDERIIPLHTSEFEAFQNELFPARQVPTLVVKHASNNLTNWDSLAIAEHLHEQHPEVGIWPANVAARAAARSLCAEMHAGFQTVRSTMPMNLKRQYATFQPTAEAVADIQRICSLWSWAQQHWGQNSSYLFGDRFTAADAFFAPVAARFKTYGITLEPHAAQYVNALLSHPDVVQFYRDGEKEDWVMEHNELGID